MAVPNLGSPQNFARGAAPVGTATGPEAMLPTSAAVIQAQVRHDAAVTALRKAVDGSGFGGFTSSPQALALYIDVKMGPDKNVIDATIKWAGNALQTAKIAASLGQIWSKAEASAPTDGSASTSGVLVGAIGKFGMTELRSVLATLVSDVITFIAQLLAEEAVITFGTAATIGAAGGYIGELVALVVAAVTEAVNLISGGPKVQITNGNWYSAKDYASTNLGNAITWIKGATPGQLMSLTPKCAADTFGLFLANPVWLYENQKPLGIKQPPPADYGTGSLLDTVYQRLPGAFELINQVQFLLAASMVLTSPQRLPFFAATLSEKNATKNAVDQTITSYKPFFYVTTVPGFIGTKLMTAPGWAPGVADWDLPKKAQSSLDRGVGIPDASGPVYAGCPNLFTNDNVITPSGKGIADKGATIASQTVPATNAFILQLMFPALSTYQCQELFSATFPLYNSTMSKVRTWLAAQNRRPTATSLQQFNLTDDDEKSAMALWDVLHPQAPKPAPLPAVRSPRPAPLPVMRFSPPARAPIIPAAVDPGFFHASGPKRNAAIAAGVGGGILLGVAAKAKLASLFLAAPIAVVGGAVVAALVWRMRK
jgi:hypothetical protein